MILDPCYILNQCYELSAIIIILSFGHLPILIWMTNLRTFNASFLKTSISDLTQCCTEPFNYEHPKRITAANNYMGFIEPKAILHHYGIVVKWQFHKQITSSLFHLDIHTITACQSYHDIFTNCSHVFGAWFRIMREVTWDCVEQNLELCSVLKFA